jgi:hypothetical protein
MAQASVINPYQQFVDASGEPLSAGTLTFFLNGTETVATIYSDPALTVAQSNPYTLDAYGRIQGDVRFADTLTVRIKDSDGNQIGSDIDDVTCFDDSTVFAAWSASINYGSGGSNIVTYDSKYYVSLQANNFNKQPDTETSWWQQINFIRGSSAASDRIDAIAGITPSDQLLITGTSGASWEGSVTVADISDNYLEGMETSNGTDSQHDIDVAVGRCNDSTNSISMALSSAFTKQIDATWASGSGNGGLASGATLSTNTTYHVFVVLVGGSVDVMFDSSVTCANGVANNAVTNFRRIGSIMTNSSSNIVAYEQDGDYFYWDVLQLDVNTGNPGTSAVTATLSLPTGIEIIALIYGFILMSDDSNDTHVLFTSPSQTDTTPTSTISQLKVAQVPTGESFYSGTNVEVKTNTSGQIRYRLSASSASMTFQLNTAGWIDSRGR